MRSGREVQPSGSTALDSGIRRVYPWIQVVLQLRPKQVLNSGLHSAEMAKGEALGKAKTKQAQETGSPVCVV